MKRLSFLLVMVVLLAACKKDHNIMVENKWKYDTDQMYKVTAEYLKDHPNPKLMMSVYDTVFLKKYRDVTFEFNKDGKFVWNDHGKILKGGWSMSGNDSTIVTDLDTMKINYKILEITPEKMVWDDGRMSTDKKFKLSKPILKPIK